MNSVRVEKSNRKNRELTLSIVHFMLEKLELNDISLDIEFSNILRDEYALGFSSRNAAIRFPNSKTAIICPALTLPNPLMPSAIYASLSLAIRFKLPSYF